MTRQRIEIPRDYKTFNPQIQEELEVARNNAEAILAAGSAVKAGLEFLVRPFVGRPRNAGAKHSRGG